MKKSLRSVSQNCVIFAQTAIPVKPAKSAFDHLALHSQLPVAPIGCCRFGLIGYSSLPLLTLTHCLVQRTLRKPQRDCIRWLNCRLIGAQMFSLRQFRKYSYTVCQTGKSCGSSRHGHPALKRAFNSGRDTLDLKKI